MRRLNAGGRQAGSAEAGGPRCEQPSTSVNGWCWVQVKYVGWGLALASFLSGTMYLAYRISADSAVDMALHEYYEKHPDELKQRLEKAAQDPVLRPIIAQLQSNGPQAIMHHWSDEALLRRFSDAMGGVPEEVWGKQVVDFSLHEAAREGIMAAVRGKLQQNVGVGHMAHLGAPVDINAVDDERGMTAFAYAVAYGHAGVAQELMKARADMRVADRQGNTVLHFAAGYGHKELCTLLLPHIMGTDLYGKHNHAGQSAVDVAKINGHDVAGLLGQLRKG